jgi:hypothetical protein
LYLSTIGGLSVIRKSTVRLRNQQTRVLLAVTPKVHSVTRKEAKLDRYRATFRRREEEKSAAEQDGGNEAIFKLSQEARGVFNFEGTNA